MRLHHCLVVHYEVFLGSHNKRKFRNYIGVSHAQNSVPFVRIRVRMLVGKSEATGYMCVKCVHQIVAEIVLLASIAFVIEIPRTIRITRASGVTYRIVQAVLLLACN